MNAYVTLTDWPAVVNSNGQLALPAVAAVDVFGLDVFDFQIHMLSVGAGATALNIETSMQNQLDDNTLWLSVFTTSSAPTVGCFSAHIPSSTGNGPLRYLRWRLAGTVTSGPYVFFIRGIGRSL